MTSKSRFGGHGLQKKIRQTYAARPVTEDLEVPLEGRESPGTEGPRERGEAEAGGGEEDPVVPRTGSRTDDQETGNPRRGCVDGHHTRGGDRRRREPEEGICRRGPRWGNRRDLGDLVDTEVSGAGRRGFFRSVRVVPEVWCASLVPFHPRRVPK